MDRRWYWAAPLLLDEGSHPVLLGADGASAWEGDSPGAGFLAHLDEARAMADAGESVLGRPPDDLAEVLAEVALGGPAQCALRSLSAVSGLPLESESCLRSAAWAASAFRNFFNAPEVTGVVAGASAAAEETEEAATERYWREVVKTRHRRQPAGAPRRARTCSKGLAWLPESGRRRPEDRSREQCL